MGELLTKHVDRRRPIWRALPEGEWSAAPMKIAPVSKAAKPLSIGIFGFDGISLLDLSGPLEAFTAARTYSADGTNRSCYDARIIGVTGRFALSLHRRLGRTLVYPNEVVEKNLGVAATTRNWSTISVVCRVLEDT